MRLIIHATNVTGLGASQVVISFLKALEEVPLSFDSVTCYVPESGIVSDIRPRGDSLRIMPYRRRLPRLLSRVVETLFPQKCFGFGDVWLVLGDIPLRTRSHQLLFVHQPHLIKSRVNRWVSRRVTCRAMRILTRLNAPFVDQVIVQTEAMKEGLYQSYQNWEERKCIKVVGQPPPYWFFDKQKGRNYSSSEAGLKLFYPAADYQHKNHSIFQDLFRYDVSGVIKELTLTVDKEKLPENPQWVNCVGRLDHASCLAAYQKADALAFPSLLESYGLPLVEAMTLGLPIVVSDLPYARVLCGEQAIYFNPESASSLFEAIKLLKTKLHNGWQPDWSDALARLPRTWEEVVEAFLEEL